MTIVDDDLQLVRWALKALLDELADDMDTRTFVQALDILDCVDSEIEASDEIHLRDVQAQETQLSNE